MADAAANSTVIRNPVDYVVAVWLGTPKDELEKGLREGWIRAPGGADPRTWVEQRGLAGEDAASESSSTTTLDPPSPDAAATAPGEDVSSQTVRDRVEALLRRLDPAMDAATFDAAWGEAGSDDAARTASLVSFVGHALNVDTEGTADIADRLEAIESLASTYEGDTRFVRIAATDAGELQRLASVDSGVRRALADHAAWTLVGGPTRAREGDSAGRYDRFDVNSGEQLLSDAWIGDRAKHAAWLSARAAGRSTDVDGDGWRFVDRAAGDAMTIEVAGTAGGSVHQVIFANDDGDRITGGATTDRVHGGQGDDVLRGRAGDDLLEGAAGDDLIQGGAGRDLVHGQQGRDELEGGSGDDELSGGSGDDELIGGRGDDVLRGGAGDDVYRFDAGDGKDTIDDDSGVIVFNDEVVAGTMRRSGEGWVSADGRFRFSLEGESDAPVLVVRDAAADGSGSMRIPSWTPGAFGISLAADSEDVQSDADLEDEANEDVSVGELQSSNAEAGNEAPLGPMRTLSPPSPGATMQPTAHWQGSADYDTLPLVDPSMISAALDGWSADSAPGGYDGNVSIGVTSFDVSDAIATAEFAPDGDEGAVSVPFDARLASLLPPSPFDAARLPPELALRAPS